MPSAGCHKYQPTSIVSFFAPSCTSRIPLANQPNFTHILSPYCVVPKWFFKLVRTLGLDSTPWNYPCITSLENSPCRPADEEPNLVGCVVYYIISDSPSDRFRPGALLQLFRSEMVMERIRAITTQIHPIRRKCTHRHRRRSCRSRCSLSEFVKATRGEL